MMRKSTIIGLTILAVIVMKLSTAPAWPQTSNYVWKPPAKYNCKRPGIPVIWQRDGVTKIGAINIYKVPQHIASQRCAGMGAGGARACATKFGRKVGTRYPDGSISITPLTCAIVLPDYGTRERGFGAEADEMLCHEIAHCMGWEGSHPGGW